MFTIPFNDYKENVEVREEAVQGICEVFLGGGADSIFHPFKESYYRAASKYIAKHKGDKRFHYFHGRNDNYYENIRIRSAEVKKAVKLLLEHGYYLHRRIYIFRN